jgi:histidyl-tRNA synthetase
MAPKISQFLSKEQLQEFQNIKLGLKALDVPFQEDERLVRGLDYYCGICFEIKEIKNEERMQDTLIGGGRYDYLANYLGRKSDKPLPGIG